MNRAFVRDFEESRALLFLQWADELDLQLDAVESPVGRFARLAVGGVDPRMTELHGHSLERPLLASGVHRNRHRRARSEGGEKEVVGGRPGVGPP